MKYLRGHHLQTLLDAYTLCGSFGKYFEEKLGFGLITITDSLQDEICLECPGRQPQCSEFGGLDRKVAHTFGLNIGDIYHIDKLKLLISRYENP